MLNPVSLDTICASITYAFGIDVPECAAPPNEALVKYIDEIFDGGKADRVFMYNPDAIAEWIYRKYPQLCAEAKDNTDIEIPLRSVMPSVTPVCFGTMYTGAQPEIHGIQRYEKPVIKIDTLFDALIRAGKKPAIIAYGDASLAKIFLERDMDYYYIPESSAIGAVNAIAAELIIKDQHDFILLYNGNYDSKMHKFAPESVEALSELRSNILTFDMIRELIERHWKGHNTMLGFAMDHGCHEIDGGCGSHGLDMEEDLNIVHLYKGYRKD